MIEKKHTNWWRKFDSSLYGKIISMKIERPFSWKDTNKLWDHAVRTVMPPVARA